MEINRKNRGFLKAVSDEDILIRTFDFYYLLKTNSNPVLDKIKELALCDYKVIAKFIYKGFNGQNIFCNGQLLAQRKNKHTPIIFGDNVKLIDGLPLHQSGSNQYPTVRFKDNWCVLEFISDGLPIIDHINGWEINIISMDKIN